MVYTLRFFPSKCSLFHNSKFFGSCNIHILYTVCAKIKKNNSGTKRLTHGSCKYYVVDNIDRAAVFSTVNSDQRNVCKLITKQ